MVYVLSACRTPSGKFVGGLSRLTPAALGKTVADRLLASLPDKALVDEVIFGQVLQAGTGMNLARQIALASGLPESVPAYTVNKVCASGMKAITLGASAIMSGQANLVLAGGVEVMSMAPFLVDAGVRWGMKMGNLTLRDSLITDGLTDPTHGIHMGLTAEALAKKYGISREEQDRFALESQQRWKKAAEAGAFSLEITPVVAGKTSLREDETPRPDTNLEKLAALQPAFSPEGTITAGNASALADGAAAVLLASEEAAKIVGIEPLGRITDWCSVGLAPMDMGLGPAMAIRKLLAATNTRLEDYGLFEVNEAFAAQVLACLREEPIPPAKLNVHGGAIALGHPLGCSGARIIVTLLHALRSRGEKAGLASLCIGGGMGMAAALET
jgi:acetyl-CoA C-acetyltransferase